MVALEQVRLALAGDVLPCSSRPLVAVRFGKSPQVKIARVWALTVFAAFTSAWSTATASEPAPIAVRISEDLHEACPKRPTTFERLRARLPHVREAAEGEPAVDVAVHVQQRGGTSHGTITLVAAGERAERAASAASCDRVLAALAVMAAIGLEGGDVPTPSAPAEAPAETSPMPEAPAEMARMPEAPVQPRRPPRTAPPRHRPRGAPEPRPRIGIALGTSVEVSANRALVVMPGLFGQVGFPGRFTPLVRVGVRRSFREDTVSRFGTVGLQWSEVALTGCADLVRQPTLRVGPCLNAEGGILEAIVIEPLPSRVRTAVWLSASAAARISWRPLRAMSFELLGGVRAPLIRNELLFEPATLVYEAPRVVPFLGGALVGHLP
ncbi:MAG: hypothetical protein BGO98_37985 [Myxococcales bacterium 68-20]|nr:MAG: hypothetical protein BGO98_37985 [Myxococcales bacterium 68-20]